MEFLPPLRLLRWDAYPRKSLPRRFYPENLIELDMQYSQLEKLWEGTQPLASLKKMNLSESSRLKELPDLSNATNLEILNLNLCSALEELPSSFSNLHKLVQLDLMSCKSLEVIPSLINLVSLQWIYMDGCSRLKKFPNIGITNHMLGYISISGSVNLKTLSIDLPTSVKHLYLSENGIARITACIKDLHNLQTLVLSSCKRLVSLPELPSSLRYLTASNCESLERVSSLLNIPHAELDFSNCFKLDGEARETIIQGSFDYGWALLPGIEVPADFNHRARGNSLTIRYSTFNRFKVCLVISPYNLHEDTYQDDDSDDYEFKVPKRFRRCIDIYVPHIYGPESLESEHLLIFSSSLPFIDPSEVNRKIVLQFQTYQKFNIMEYGIQIYRDETHRYNNGGSGNEGGDSDLSDTHESEDEEGYVSESEEAFKEKDEDIGKDSDYESVSRKRTREMTSDESNEATDEEGYESKTTMIKNVRWGIQRLRLS